MARREARLGLWTGFGLVVLFVPALRAADCNQNGVEDFLDIEGGASADCNSNGVPDDCEVRAVNYGLDLLGALRIGGDQQRIRAADLDGDGDADLVWSRSENPTVVGFLWNDGQGGFDADPDSALRLELTTSALAVFDADGDSRLDVFLARERGFTWYRNLGGRSFELQDDAPAPFDPGSFAAGDLDGDGDADLAAAADSGVVIVRNLAGEAPRFQVDAPIRIGTRPFKVLLADLDGDLDLDLLTLNALDNLSVSLNDGAGRFGAARHLGPGGDVLDGALLDLESDGDLDLALSLIRKGAPRLVLLANRGDGAFERLDDIEARSRLKSLVGADLDGDGDLDLAAISAGAAGGTIVAFFSHGNGRLSAPRSLRSESGAFLLAAEIAGGGTPELLLAQPRFQQVLVFGAALEALGADCDRDGISDDCQLAGKDCNGNRVPDACEIAAGALRDCDQDGVPDPCEDDCNQNGEPDDCELAGGRAADCDRNGVPDECDLRPSFRLLPAGEYPIDAAGFHFTTLDFDRDGDIDVVITNAAGLWLHRNRAGVLGDRERLLERSGVLRSLPADFDGDGAADLCVLDRSGLPVFLFIPARGPGGRIIPLDAFPGPPVPASPVLEDLDGDRRADIVLAAIDGERSFFQAFLNDGQGSFGASGPIGVPSIVWSMLLADFEADGDADLLLGTTDGSLELHANDGRGGFQRSRALRVGRDPVLLASGDVNGDGWTDAAAYTLGSGRLHVVLNQGGGQLDLQDELYIPSNSGRGALEMADLDGDGAAEILLAYRPGGSDRSSRIGAWSAGAERGLQERPRHLIEVQGSFSQLAIAEIDGDGAVDLLSSFNPDCGGCESPTHALAVFRNASRAAAAEDRNANGVPDRCEAVPFHRGDADGDGALSITDAIALLGYLFLARPAPACLEAADADNDGRIVLSDAVAILNYLLGAGPPPAEPGPPGAPCGLDPDAPGSPAALGCGEYLPCEDPRRH
jgi:hypothetical protein